MASSHLADGYDNDDDDDVQVMEEKSRGLEPGPSGGHENIHCRLEPLDHLTPSTFTATRIIGKGKTQHDGRLKD